MSMPAGMSPEVMRKIAEHGQRIERTMGIIQTRLQDLAELPDARARAMAEEGLAKMEELKELMAKEPADFFAP